MTVSQLIYISERNLATHLDLNYIVERSRRNNTRVNVSGFLMFDGDYFIQVLEGGRLQVTQTFSRLANDPRHLNIRIISCLDRNDRLFPNWSMGFFDDIPQATRMKLLEQFTIGDLNPNTIPTARITDFLQSLARLAMDAPNRH